MMKNDVAKRTLVVDLDGTLIKTNIFREQLVKAFLRNPFTLVYLILINLYSIAKLKRALSEIVFINPKTLPYNEKVISLIKKYKMQKQKVILASACDVSSLAKISDSLGFFSDYIGSSDRFNAKGKNKLIAIKKLINDESFDYVGSSRSDKIVFGECVQPYVTTGNKFFKIQIWQLFPSIINIEEDQKSFVKLVSKQARLRHWLKNFLIVCPALFPILILETSLLFNLFVFFILYSITVSSTYVINDIVDVENDRQDYEKRFRPIAAGNIDMLNAFVTSILVMFLAIFCAVTAIGVEAALLLMSYIGFSFFYTFYAKKVPVLDLFFLASFYAHRILAGCIIIGAEISVWITLFAFLTFLSLGALKRIIEIDNNAKQGIPAKGIYESKHRLFLTQCSNSAAFGACLIFALYTLEKFKLQTSLSEFILSFISISIIFFLLKIMFDVEEGKVNSDPVEYLLTQRWALLFAISISIATIMFGVYADG